MDASGGVCAVPSSGGGGGGTVRRGREQKISSPLVEQFGSRSMYGREQLVSLFYYMGMLTFGQPAPGQAVPDLVIPNRVMRELQWEFLAFSVKDNERIWMDTLDLESALHAMAMEGEIEPLLSEATASEIKKAVTQAHEQLDRYVSDEHLVSLLTRGKALKAGALVFVGAKDVLFRPWPPEARPAPAPKRAKKAPAKRAAAKVGRRWGRALIIADPRAAPARGD